VPDQLEPGHPYVADASHNVRCDVGAAREVFSSGVPMVVLTNDVTTSAWWDGPPVQKLMTATNPPEAQVVGKLLEVWLQYRTKIFGRKITGTCPHDPLTVAEATQPRFVTYARGVMTIHRDATSSFILDSQGPHYVGVHVEVESFLRWFSDAMGRDGAEPSAPGVADKPLA
jgi:purine nucleosidase